MILPQSGDSVLSPSYYSFTCSNPNPCHHLWLLSLSCPVCPCRLHLWTPPETAEFPNLHSLGLSPPQNSQQGRCSIQGVTRIQYPVRIKARVRCPHANARPVTQLLQNQGWVLTWEASRSQPHHFPFLLGLWENVQTNHALFFLSGTFFPQIFLWFIPSCPQILPSMFYHGSHSFTASFSSVASIIPWHKQSY